MMHGQLIAHCKQTQVHTYRQLNTQTDTSTQTHTIMEMLVCVHACMHTCTCTEKGKERTYIREIQHLLYLYWPECWVFSQQHEFAHSYSHKNYFISAYSSQHYTLCMNANDTGISTISGHSPQPANTYIAILILTGNTMVTSTMVGIIHTSQCWQCQTSVSNISVKHHAV